ncbi:hypothetical protein YC2023_072752 [Brassica napus]
MRYIIGDGELINMWTDPWIPDHPPRPPHARGDFTEGEKVKEYFDANRLQWNEGKLREVVIDEDVERILALRISPTAKQDLMGWHYNEDGLYTEMVETQKETNGSSRGAKAHVVEGIVLSEFLDLEVQCDKLKVSLAMVNRRMRSLWRKARQLKDFESG